MIRLVSFFLLALALSPLFAADGDDVRFDQRIGERLPLDVVFTDTAGRSLALRQLLGDRPVVLYFGYARCPQLCAIVSDGAVAALRQIEPEVGRDLDVVSISLDPDESALENTRRQSEAVHRYGRAGAADGWHFLTGDEAAVRAVADAAGFRYRFDPMSRHYAHPSGFVVLTADGVVSRYFLGIDFTPVEVARAVRLAAAGGTGEPVFDIILQCFRGGGVAGDYGPLIWRVLTVSVVLTVLALAGGVARMLRQERRAAAKGGVS